MLGRGQAHDATVLQSVSSDVEAPKIFQESTRRQRRASKSAHTVRAEVKTAQGREVASAQCLQAARSQGASGQSQRVQMPSNHAIAEDKGAFLAQLDAGQVQLAEIRQPPAVHQRAQ